MTTDSEREYFPVVWSDVQETDFAVNSDKIQFPDMIYPRGWNYKERIPHEHLNAIQMNIGRWAKNSVHVRADLGKAARTLEEGLRVDIEDYEAQSSENILANTDNEDTSADINGGQIWGITGRHLLYEDNNSNLMALSLDLKQKLWSVDISGQTTTWEVAGNGHYVVIAYIDSGGNFDIDILDEDNGDTIDTINIDLEGGTFDRVFEIQFDAGIALITYDINVGSSHNATAIDLSTQSISWQSALSVDGTRTVFEQDDGLSAVANGKWLYVVDSTPSPSSYSIERWDFSDGTSEGTNATPISGNGSIEHISWWPHKEVLLVIATDGTDIRLETYDIDLNLVDSNTISDGESLNRVEGVDQDNIYIVKNMSSGTEEATINLDTLDQYEFLDYNFLPDFYYMTRGYALDTSNDNIRSYGSQRPSVKLFWAGEGHRGKFFGKSYTVRE